MRRLALIIAAVAGAATSSNAFSQTTYYSVGGPFSPASGTFSVIYDSSAMTYSLGSLDLNIGAHFTTADSGFQAGLGIDDYVGGSVALPGNLAAGTNDFRIAFDPALVAQPSQVDYVLANIVTPTLTGPVTLQLLGAPMLTSETFTVTGGAEGTFTLNYDVGMTNISLGALDLFVGPQFDPINSMLTASGSSLQLGGSLGGSGASTVGLNDFHFLFDPTLTTQVAVIDFSFLGLTFPLQPQPIFITQIPQPGVPEPATWAMMLLGFGVAGTMMRRRKLRAASPLFA